MSDPALIKYCDQLAQHIKDILTSSKVGKDLQAMGVKGHENDGRGFIPLIFTNHVDAFDMIKKYKKDYLIRVDTVYLPQSTVKTVGCDGLMELVDSYDPEVECVCLLSVGWDIKDPSPDSPNASMIPFIVKK